jgi:MYXO-CTERM domain-containing protein
MPRLPPGRTFAGLALVLVAGCGLVDQPRAISRSSAAASAAATAAGPGAVDILFMIDDSSSMTSMQLKLGQQIQSFVGALDALPGGFPDVHVAVVSSDLGAPGDSTFAIGCTAVGDRGAFRVDGPVCTSGATLEPGSTFVSNVGGVANYSGNLADVLSCILLLGSNGCGFEHQLAAVTRALGADGAAPPAENAGFLRRDAELAIILLTNEDDCSAPADTLLYSSNGSNQSIENPLGPIANYRCNQFGHLCKDATGSAPDQLITPPASPPFDTSGDPPSLTLTSCESDEECSGLLTPVATFAQQIMALKTDPSQIVVGAIVAPPDPYTVEWLPPAPPPPGTGGELWPRILHSCGPAGGDDLNPAGQISGDLSFGDPAVRISQWVRAFGDRGFTASICDADYSTALQTFATEIGQHLQPSGAAVPPAPTSAPSGGPLATSARCPAEPPIDQQPSASPGCSTAEQRPGALAIFLAVLGLAGSLRRRRV